MANQSLAQQGESKQALTDREYLEKVLADIQSANFKLHGITRLLDHSKDGGLKMDWISTEGLITILKEIRDKLQEASCLDVDDIFSEKAI